MKGLENKVAFVTGGSSGIGYAAALGFVREGARVVIADINAEAGEAGVAEIRKSGGEATFIRTDVSKSADIQAMIRQTVETYGRLDFAVNNAGIGGAAALTADYPEEEWQRVLDINLTGVWLCMKYSIPHMLKAGGGALINVASILGHVGFANSGAYVAAKHAILGLTKTTAIEYATQNIRAVAVCPGFVATPLIEEAGMSEGSDLQRMIADLHPVKRLGRPEEISELIVWLCSDSASFITGNSILVDGGYVAQ